MPAKRRDSRVTKREGEVREIMRALRSLVAMLGQSARSIEQTTGVTNAQLFVLQLLDGAGALSINDIAALALTHQSAVSVIVTRLEDAGYVSRARSTEDARRVEVTLSASGRKLLKGAPPPPTTRLLEALRSMSPETRRHLGRGLASLATLLGDSGEEPTLLFEPAPRTNRRRGA